MLFTCFALRATEVPESKVTIDLRKKFALGYQYSSDSEFLRKRFLRDLQFMKPNIVGTNLALNIKNVITELEKLKILRNARDELDRLRNSPEYNENSKSVEELNQTLKLKKIVLDKYNFIKNKFLPKPRLSLNILKRYDFINDEYYGLDLIYNIELYELLLKTFKNKKEVDLDLMIDFLDKVISILKDYQTMFICTTPSIISKL